MNLKKKSHSIHFTPHLEEGEDLVWVGSPQNNPYLSFHFDEDARKNFQFSFFLITLFVYSLILLSSLGAEAPQMPPASIYESLLHTASLIASFAAIAFITAFCNFGKTYYAITNKRVLVMQRPIWAIMDAASLLMLPEFDLHGHEDESVSIQFAQLRRRASSDEYMGYLAANQTRLERLSAEDAEMASEALESAKSEALEQYVREYTLDDTIHRY